MSRGLSNAYLAYFTWLTSFGSPQIFSGQIPWAGLRDHKVITEILINQNRPLRPPEPAMQRGLNDQMWDMMTACWKTLPEERPHMRQVVDTLMPNYNWEHREVRRISAHDHFLSFMSHGFIPELSSQHDIREHHLHIDEQESMNVTTQVADSQLVNSLDLERDVGVCWYPVRRDQIVARIEKYFTLTSDRSDWDQIRDEMKIYPVSVMMIRIFGLESITSRSSVYTIYNNTSRPIPK